MLFFSPRAPQIAADYIETASAKMHEESTKARKSILALRDAHNPLETCAFFTPQSNYGSFAETYQTASCPTSII